MSCDSDKNTFSMSTEQVRGTLHRFTHDAMACTWGVYILGEERDYARQAAQAAFEEVDRLEQELSRFVEHSDIARINALSAGGQVLIGADAMQCLQLASEIHRQTRGAFDVTIGGMLERTAKDKYDKPDVVDDQRSTPDPPSGMCLLKIDRRTRTVDVGADGLIVDLGGIGKGYAIDRAVSVLSDWSIETALVHSGQSTLLALGGPPDKDGWTVAIRDPNDQAKTLGDVHLRDRALSGSGALLHGQHIIDPRTGQRANGPVSAWCIAESAALADALSTAFMVLTEGEVEDYCRQHADIGAVQYVQQSGCVTLRCFGLASDLLDQGNGAS